MTVTITDVTQKEVETDNERVIKKQWTETKSEEFMVQEKLNQLSRIENSINQQLKTYNEIVDDLETAKTELSLNVEVSAQKEITDKTQVLKK